MNTVIIIRDRVEDYDKQLKAFENMQACTYANVGYL